MSKSCSVVILISGNGSNLQALIDAQNQGWLKIVIEAVISNNADAYGLQRAADAGIPHYIVSHREYPDRHGFDQALRHKVDTFDPDLVVLAGFMRILTPEFVRHYQGRMFNIHPSLLPKYPGLHTHRRVLAAGDQRHGATVHFVTEALDGGPAVIQASVPILTGDTETTLAKRVQTQEHIIYPMAVDWFANRRLSIAENRIFLDGELLPTSGFEFTPRLAFENHQKLAK